MGTEFVGVGTVADAFAAPAAARASGVCARRGACAAAGRGPGHRFGLLPEDRPAFFRDRFALGGLGEPPVRHAGADPLHVVDRRQSLTRRSGEYIRAPEVEPKGLAAPLPGQGGCLDTRSPTEGRDA